MHVQRKSAEEHSRPGDRDVPPRGRAEQPLAGQGVLSGQPRGSGDPLGGRLALRFGDERRTAIIVAGGPSTSLYSPETLERFPTIAVNDAWRRFPSAAALYAADRGWWEVHATAVAAGFTGRCFCSREAAAPARACQAQPLEIRLEGGLSRDPAVLRAGGRTGNSGAQAMNLAYLAGARRLVLVGFDMKIQDGKEHWFGAHPRPLRNGSPYQTYILGMMQLAMDLADEGIEVMNGAADSALTYWKRYTPGQLLAILARA